MTVFNIRKDKTGNDMQWKMRSVKRAAGVPAAFLYSDPGNG